MLAIVIGAFTQEIVAIVVECGGETIIARDTIRHRCVPAFTLEALAWHAISGCTARLTGSTRLADVA